MKECRLASNDSVYTPGVLEYLKHGYKTSRGKQRAVFVTALSGGWRLREEIAILLLAGKIAYTVKDEAVSFSVDDGLEVFKNDNVSLSAVVSPSSC